MRRKSRVSIAKMTLFLLADCWAHAFSYLDATSLARVALMCKHWRSLSDESVLWIHHCARLWKGKQNHYLERWVDISHIENVESIVDVEDARRGDLSYIQQQVRVLRQLHAAYSQNYDYLQMTAPNSQDSGAARQHLGRIHRALTDMVLLQTPVASGDAQRRMHMPVSQYYLSAVVRKETLLFNRLGKPDSVCEAGAQEEVSAALSAPLRITQQHVDALDAMGALLTWKQSYMASIRDSKRTWLTHTVGRLCGGCALANLLSWRRSCGRKGSGSSVSRPSWSCVGSHLEAISSLTTEHSSLATAIFCYIEIALYSRRSDTAPARIAVQRTGAG